MAGPLHGVRIIEIAGIGPGPFTAMMLADHGAEVIRVDRPGTPTDPRDVNARSRQVVTLDFKTPDGIAAVRDLCRDADGIVEGFRPGVMEKLGLGPDVLLRDNPRLVYGRMTGWGQTGPYAPYAGHDINYIALAGALHSVGDADRPPPPPLNLIGDFGGGGMLLAFGMVSAILHARQTGQGQVVDCAMTDGTALMMAQINYLYTIGWWTEARGANLLDGGAPFYGSYETADGKYVALGSIEPQFHAILLERLGLTDDPDFTDQNDQSAWSRRKLLLADIFRAKTRDQWCAILEHSDVCFAPVLSPLEAPHHPHNVARGTYVEVDGVVQPAPAPRSSATPLDPPRRPVMR